MSADLRDVWKRLAGKWEADYQWELATRVYLRSGFNAAGMTPPPPKYIREEALR
jgi:hypothetical protein